MTFYHHPPPVVAFSPAPQTAILSVRRYGPWPDNARRNAEENWLAYQRGRQYRIEKQAHGGDRKSEAVKSKGNESQEPCPLIEKTAEKIAAVSGVCPRTIKNDAHFAEAVDVLVADSAPIATRSLEQPRHE